jgi:hypothetical protein
MAEVGVFQDAGGAARKHETDGVAALRARWKPLALKDGGGVIFAMKQVPDTVHAGFGDFVARLEDFFGLRCALHQFRRPESKISVQER